VKNGVNHQQTLQGELHASTSTYSESDNYAASPNSAMYAQLRNEASPVWVK
jgi:hypothetical protein